jgi:hypothetical protein
VDVGDLAAFEQQGAVVERAVVVLFDATDDDAISGAASRRRATIGDVMGWIATRGVRWSSR